MELLSCILFPGYSGENTTMEAAPLLCMWGPSGPLPEQVPLAASAQRKIKTRDSLRDVWIFNFILQCSLVTMSLVCCRMLSGKGKCKCSAIRMIVHSDPFYQDIWLYLCFSRLQKQLSARLKCFITCFLDRKCSRIRHLNIGV